jgi:hypothetical protein
VRLCAFSREEADAMQAAAAEKPFAPDPVDAERVRDLILVRIATTTPGLARGELAADLAPFVAHRLSAPEWRAQVEREVAALAQAGLATVSGARIAAGEGGLARAALVLNVRGRLPAWEEARDVRLVARALGLHREPAKRLAALARPEGLRIAIVQRGFGLKIKGVATPSRLRTALASVALERAFGNRIKAGLAGKSGFSPKAGRLLAAQLLKKPRDPGTDGRLIAALAAEHVGAAHADAAALRLALLRRYLDGPGDATARRQRPTPAPRVARPRLVEPVAPPPVVVARPDLAGFAQEVRRHAGARAQGWPGNRKAYISHVWQTIREGRPEWGLSEIEFKCMLTEAHRAGTLALANADLKDNSSIKDLQESAVVYKNAVFHFIRVDG